MFTIILFTLVGILCLVELFVNYNENARTIKKIPGFKDVFFFGNCTVVFGMDSVGLFKLARESAKKFKGIFRFYSLSLAAVNIFNPSDAEIVMSTMKHHEKSIIYKFFKPWLHDGLLVSKGSKWQDRRKILTSAFHFNILRKYFLIIEENNQKLVNVMEENSGEPVDIVPILSEYTLNSISESAMGVELDNDPMYSGLSYKNAIYETIKIFVYRFMRIYLYPDFLFNLSPAGIKQARYLSIIHTFIRNVINKRKQNFQNNEKESDTLADNDNYVYKKKRRAAMLDLLISAEKEGLINDDGIIEEVNTFMFEGHDTTAAGLTFCLLTLAENQDVQEKVYQELQSIFNGRDDLTLEDLTMMNYLERCIKESMRLYPPVPFISRTLSETVKLSNYTVPVGTMCHIHIFDMHRQESLFKNAEKFDPDRFLPENSVGRHPYSYIPFSAGPRNCIGQKFAMMEMKSALSAILKNYKLLPVTTSKDLEFIADLVLRNSKPIYLKFIKRH
ncbi:cytochrome P450 4C1-like [Pieris napi]|uniref:cytochrome P450 4C1-like n=1 Tax=Pieris napi TaxID=78633 RepID=UPI001FB8AA16|nr:cytochrome P450 4C1-like [Pieris napi]